MAENTKKRLDEIDRKILANLQRDGRLTVQDLAARVGLTISPCLRRVRMLEEAGVIRGYSAVVDQASIGLPISVFVQVKLERQREEELQRFDRALGRFPEVVEAYLMTGVCDYLLRVVVADLPAYEAFLRDKLTRVEGVRSIESSFALKQAKSTLALPMG
ncbi:MULTISPECIES: Lrp/AsnC family transcriptional regulator [unclassified Beijerinckia]|uniref:Lrp/AsnC family transcriptional regulator n=1 Tax=unclassified Beijerinckia TaxID=2638183 RepID=UPI00089422E5|nr:MULTISPECIES: Lrp/AsnC family transcriptional regulator [unclassified Beijerinckia]MDH7794323.1 Lrp/AsnC family leucine-responsive transcriptional regulator [Beijerinckia sp. GAS462]SEB58835.1 transcriptional regulator, AsnC family [Beijerinckia sp. 28-YEA-48]